MSADGKEATLRFSLLSAPIRGRNSLCFVSHFQIHTGNLRSVRDVDGLPHREISKIMCRWYFCGVSTAMRLARVAWARVGKPVIRRGLLCDAAVFSNEEVEDHSEDGKEDDDNDPEELVPGGATASQYADDRDNVQYKNQQSDQTAAHDEFCEY